MALQLGSLPAALPLGVRLWRGDITRLELGAIVNAANEGLWAGSGVCGAIHSAAGRRLEDECREKAPCPTGSAVLTGGYRLPAKHVIHAVGPRGERPAQLASAYRAILDVCEAAGLASVAIPCISTGVYGYPPRSAAAVAIRTVRDWLAAREEERRVAVVFCVFLGSDESIYQELLPQLLAEEAGSGAEEAKAGGEGGDAGSEGGTTDRGSDDSDGGEEAAAGGAAGAVAGADAAASSEAASVSSKLHGA